MRSRSEQSPDAWGAASRFAAGSLTALALVLAACGGATTIHVPLPSPGGAAKATLAPTARPAAAPAPIDGQAAVLNVFASESGDDLILAADRIALPAGNVTLNFKNADPTMDHELFVYPVQDVTKLMWLKRSGQSANEPELLKGVVGMTGSIAPSQSKQIAMTLVPGLYEMACYARMKRADGSTAYVHFDKGETLTLTVTGPGGPAASIATPAGMIGVTMQDGANGSWLFSPDRLVATAGNVTFEVTNGTTLSHDFAVYPIGDVSGPIAAGLKSGEDITLAAPAVTLFADLAPGKTDSKSTGLVAGTYVMACFMVGRNPDGSTFVHRDMGQRITFIVM